MSCNEEEFKKVAPEYESVLSASGYSQKLEYTPDEPRRRNRRKRAIYYNPPFDLQVKTNIAKRFLHLVSKHFPKHHRLNKILNRYTLKVSYSCMPSVGSYISSHNIGTLTKHRGTRQVPRTCNCNNPQECPFNGQCLTLASVYKGNISVPSTEILRRYIGVSEPEIKGRWSDHMTSFKYRKYKDKTKISQEFWSLKDAGYDLDKDRDVSFEILKKSVPYRAGGKKCNLCLTEKLLIMRNEGEVINKRDEFVNKCRHATKFMLGNIKDRGRSESDIT